MDSATLTTAPAAPVSPWGTCIMCDRPIFTAFVIRPAVRSARGRTIYTARAHAVCDELAARKVTGAELTTARAAILSGPEELARSMAERAAAWAGRGVTA